MDKKKFAGILTGAFMAVAASSASAQSNLAVDIVAGAGLDVAENAIIDATSDRFAGNDSAIHPSHMTSAQNLNQVLSIFDPLPGGVIERLFTAEGMARLVIGNLVPVVGNRVLNVAMANQESYNNMITLARHMDGELGFAYDGTSGSNIAVIYSPTHDDDMGVIVLSDRMQNGSIENTSIVEQQQHMDTVERLTAQVLENVQNEVASGKTPSQILGTMNAQVESHVAERVAIANHISENRAEWGIQIDQENSRISDRSFNLGGGGLY